MNEVTGHIRTNNGKRGEVFYAKIRLEDGKQIQRKIGPMWTGRGRPADGYFTRRTAQAALDGLLTDARRGTLAGAEHGASGKTFGDAAAEWLRTCQTERGLAETTLQDYRNAVNGRLLPEFGAETPLEKLTARRIDQYRRELFDRGEVSRRTIQKLMGQVYGILKLAYRNEWIDGNPADRVERVSLRPSGDFTVLKPAEVMAVARAARSDKLGALYTVAAFTGLRLGELRALRWQDIDFMDRTIRVRRNQPANGPEKKPKSGRVRSVPLIDQAAKALDDLSRREMFTDPGDRVFCNVTGGPMDDHPIRRGFYAALEDAGLGELREKSEPITFHDLRHTFGTLGASIWPLHDLQGYMGHADIQTTMIYVHHTPKVEAADEMSRAVSAAIGTDTLSPTLSRTRQN